MIYIFITKDGLVSNEVNDNNPSMKIKRIIKNEISSESTDPPEITSPQECREYECITAFKGYAVYREI